ARFCRVSESGLYATFRSEWNCTPIVMWHRVQIEKAVNLLFSTDLSVEEISTRLEFCSASYFRKVFKEITGQTPREVRRFGRV
ncbi:MAG: helix-turn-helix transcriptional regulator, partial [Clostridia bacterium]|nr:helix-turn-helix transcriptional regulator [Clostridia bacterium]